MAVEIRAGIKKPYSSFVNESKEGLKEKGAIELHGLGDSITNVVRAAEMLTSQGYALLVSFHTLTLTEEYEGRERNKAKVIISLSKATTFDKAYQEFESKRTANKV